MREFNLPEIKLSYKQKLILDVLTDEFHGSALMDLFEAEQLRPVLSVLQQQAGINEGQTKTIFKDLFIYIHGYASLFAGNVMAYDEQEIAASLERIFAASAMAEKENQNA